MRGLRFLLPLTPSSLLLFSAARARWFGRFFMDANWTAPAIRCYYAAVALQTRTTDVGGFRAILSKVQPPLRLDLHQLVGIRDPDEMPTLLASAITVSGDGDAVVDLLAKKDWVHQFQVAQFRILLELHLQREQFAHALQLVKLVSEHYSYLASPKTRGVFRRQTLSCAGWRERILLFMRSRSHKSFIGPLCRHVSEYLDTSEVNSPARVLRAALPSIFWSGYRVFALAFQEGDLDLAYAAQRGIMDVAASDDAELSLAALAGGQISSARGEYATAAREFDSLRSVASSRRGNLLSTSPELEKRALFGLIYINIVMGHVHDMIELAKRDMVGLIKDEFAWRDVLYFLFRHRQTSAIAALYNMLEAAEDVGNKNTARYFLQLSQLSDEEENRRLPAVARAPKRRRRFFLVIPVWGDEYVRELVTIAIPALLNQGNIPGFTAEIDLEVLIYIDRKSIEILKASAAFAALKSLIPCRVIMLQDFLFNPIYLSIWGHKITILAFVHRSALLAARRAGAGVIFWAPDILCSNNYFLVIRDILRSGKELIFCFHLRVDRRIAYNRLRPQARSVFGVVELAAEEVNAMLQTDNLASMREHTYDFGVATAWPSVIVWQVPERGLVVRAFHHHPLVLAEPVVGRYDSRIFFSNDSDLLPSVAGDFSNWHVMSGLESAVACQLTSTDERSNVPAEDGLNDKEIAHFGSRQSSVARWLFAHSVMAGTKRDASELGNAAAARILTHMKAIENITRNQPYIAGYWMPTYPRIMP
jgi:hypothetical protein